MRAVSSQGRRRVPDHGAGPAVQKRHGGEVHRWVTALERRAGKNEVKRTAVG